MWLFLGAAAIIAAVLNIVWTIRNQDAKWFRFISLSLTTLTLWAEYSLVEKWVLHEDWSALTDAVPGTSKVLLALTIASILVNSVSLFKRCER